MENLNFHSTAKFNSAKMQKFHDFCEPQNFLLAKISDNKVNLLNLKEVQTG